MSNVEGIARTPIEVVGAGARKGKRLMSFGPQPSRNPFTVIWVNVNPRIGQLYVVLVGTGQ